MTRFLRILKRIMLVILSIATILAIVIAIYLQQPQFGKSPSGARLERIKKSPNYKDGKFHNLIETPTLSEGHSILGELYKTVFKKYPRREPADSLPSVRTDLKAIPIDSNVMVWFGHSSVYIQLGGKRILVDPVFSGKASPLPASVKAYKGSNTYTADDIPAIDYLLISHDHYDHLDYETVLALKDKVKFVVCGLGVGADFEYWGYRPDQILEKDWNEKIESGSNFTIFTETSHHGSGRTFRQAGTLWMSYLIQSNDMKIYISGDGGYDNRFAEIGAKHGGVDWAIMECGQYDSAWHSVHNLPEEVVKATLGLQAKNLVPVHNSKFTLGKQPWDEPLKRITALSEKQPYRLVTPMIGEPVNLNSSIQVFRQWWAGIN
jgi:L-ascorbate metabolism protein UlaG (beta-lactamase superfamily)